MGFDFEELNNFQCGAVDVYEKDGEVIKNVAMLLNAVTMDDSNNLWVDIVRRNGKLYACVDFDREYVNGYEGINAWFSLSSNSPVNKLVINMVSKQVMRYLQDCQGYTFEDSLSPIENIFYESVRKVIGRKYQFNMMNGNLANLGALSGFNNLCNIMLEYNELTDTNSDSTLAMNMITALSNYFIVDDYKNLYNFKSMDGYNKIINNIYKNLAMDKYSARKYLSKYLTCANEERRVATSSIAKCLLSLDVPYNQICSINNVKLRYNDNGELIAIKFKNYDDAYGIAVHNDFELSDGGRETFEYFNLDLKCCNLNFLENETEGVMSLIYNLPTVESVLDGHKSLEEVLIFM